MCADEWRKKFGDTCAAIRTKLIEDLTLKIGEWTDLHHACRWGTMLAWTRCYPGTLEVAWKIRSTLLWLHPQPAHFSLGEVLPKLALGKLLIRNFIEAWKVCWNEKRCGVHVGSAWGKKGVTRANHSSQSQSRFLSPICCSPFIVIILNHMPDACIDKQQRFFPCVSVKLALEFVWMSEWNMRTAIHLPETLRILLLPNFDQVVKMWPLHVLRGGENSFLLSLFLLHKSCLKSS